MMVMQCLIVYLSVHKNMNNSKIKMIPAFLLLKNNLDYMTIILDKLIIRVFANQNCKLYYNEQIILLNLSFITASIIRQISYILQMVSIKIITRFHCKLISIQITSLTSINGYGCVSALS